MARRRSDRPAVPTLKMVAAAAGVATSTVSRAYSHPHLLRPETVEKVRAAADELGYVPHYSARALSTGRLATIAVVVPDIANPFFPPLIRAVQSRANEFGISTLLADTDEEPDKEAALLTAMQQRTDGVILASSRLAEGTVRARAALHPLVLVNRDVDGVSRVLIDCAIGVREAVDHLVDLGHRRLAYLAGPGSSWSNAERRRALLERATERRVHAVVLAERRPEHEEGVAAADDVARSGATAVVAFDDVLAQGLMAGLGQLGVSVPSDVSVIGCDDILAVRTTPPLSTIHGPSTEAGRSAVDLLRDLIDGGASEKAAVKLPAHFIQRATAGPVAGS
ncbi:LacI family DNA-binding transcriptional regulator [Georgenia sp. SUBG003]|uniref:LacI family DNA-binding transcriptional regulator n=1 Tax=Georgenia sp. SUBG003 TaxID=1497974 RepID=UPI0004D8EF20|nr:LacI family transcriptional regulator [Georgenia sp. SUBG003]